MFQRKKPQEKQETQTTQVKIKYPKPKILLMDLDSNVGDRLRELGFDIAEGSFGKPYKVATRSTPHHPYRYGVHRNGSFPLHYSEKEIVVIDLAHEELLLESGGEPVILKDGSNFSVEPIYGLIDPRPVMMAMVRTDFDKILKHGGIFVVFAHSKRTIVGADVDWWTPSQDLEVNTWAFLPDLADSSIQVHTEEGSETEIAVEFSDSLMAQILQPHIIDCQYTCTFDVDQWLGERWLPIAANKYGKSVAGIVGPDDVKAGFIFIFPQIANKAEFLEKFLLEYLPGLTPELFPYIEGGKWVQKLEYELPNILQLQSEIVKLREETKNQIAALEQQITEERISKQFMYDLITETGDALVSAVQTTLETLGFSDVVDMDAELEKNGNNEPKREDLQIQDTSPLILVEVKGIANTPKDSSALQVSKYLAPRMKALDRTDIRGLSIINHQRNIPALDRIPNPFSEDILESASQGDFGILTTWNLYKLLRNFLKHQWSHEQVKSLFYQNGFIEPIPNHYEYIGFVDKYWPDHNVIGISIEREELQLGDTLAFVLPVEYEELCVDSLQVDKEPVKVATTGQLAGVLLTIDGSTIRKKTCVYRIKSEKV